MRPILLAILFVLSHQSIFANDLEKKIDSYLEPYVSGRNFSGCVLIARKGAVEFSKAYGMADFENDVPNIPKNKFHVASITKSFTAAAILLLQERGKLNVKDSVGKFIKDYPEGNRITIHQLLSHTSGIPNYVYFPDHIEKSKNRMSVRQMVEWIQSRPLDFMPSERTNYSNSNFVLLAYLIEIVSGKSYEQFLKEEIFERLGLTDTLLPSASPQYIPQQAFGYFTVGMRDLGHAERENRNSFGASGIYTTTTDLFKWITALRAGQLLNSTSLGLMFQKQSDRYGYGWLVGERLERPVIRGDGWDGVGYAAHMIFFKNEDLVVIVLCNLNISTITSEIAIQLSAIALNESLPQPSIQILPIPKETAKEVAGLYRFGKDFYVPDATIRIIEKNGTLMELQEPSGNLVGLLSTGNLEFLHRSHWFRMVFEKDTRGKIKGMKYDIFYAQKISE